MRKQLLRMLAIAAPALVLTYAFVIELSALSVAFAKAVLGIALLYVVIKYAHNEINAIDMYTRYPVTYAAMLIAYAVVIAAAIAAS
ncbi:MAG: hypothetical protein QXS54_02050 [Candidatus Methanomethylicaceae archaeon]